MAAEGDIRPAVVGELTVVSEIAEAAHAKYLTRLGRRPVAMDADFRAHISRSEAHVLEVGGAIAGYIVLIEQPSSLCIDNVAVLPNFQGRKLGQRLLRFAEDHARNIGQNLVTLHTNKKMTETN